MANSLLAVTLGNIGLLYLETHRLTRAVALLRSAIALERQNSGGVSLPLASQLKNLSRALEWLNRPAEALEAAEEALRLNVRLYGDQHASLPTI
jgi:tetratricopeptide (TPR) repeat protein